MHVTTFSLHISVSHIYYPVIVLKPTSLPVALLRMADVPVITIFSFGLKANYVLSLKLGRLSHVKTGDFVYLTSHSFIVSSSPLDTNLVPSLYTFTHDTAVPGACAYPMTN